MNNKHLGSVQGQSLWGPPLQFSLQLCCCACECHRLTDIQDVQTGPSLFSQWWPYKSVCEAWWLMCPFMDEQPYILLHHLSGSICPRVLHISAPLWTRNSPNPLSFFSLFLWFSFHHPILSGSTNLDYFLFLWQAFFIKHDKSEVEYSLSLKLSRWRSWALLKAQVLGFHNLLVARTLCTEPSLLNQR